MEGKLDVFSGQGLPDSSLSKKKGLIKLMLVLYPYKFLYYLVFTHNLNIKRKIEKSRSCYVMIRYLAIFRKALLGWHRKKHLRMT